MRKEIKYTPEQLQNRLDAIGYIAHPWTPEQWPSVDTLVQYRYAPVLENTGPYVKFVHAYITALATNQPQPVKDEAMKVMTHAITEMRRAVHHKP